MRGAGKPASLAWLPAFLPGCLPALGDALGRFLLILDVRVRHVAAGPYEGLAKEDLFTAARWFATSVLPELSARRVVTEGTDLSLMELDEAAF